MKLDHRSFRLPESRIHPHRNRWYRTEHIKLVGRVDFAAKKLHGVITLRITPTVENLRRIELDACAMEVRSVAIDGGQLPFDYDGEILSVSVAEGLNGTHELAVDYSTTSTNRGIYFIQPDAEVSDKPVQAWTHSEAEDARFWYPCNDQLTERATSETVITIPERFRCISNGRLLSHEVRGGEATYHWQESTPHCTYLNSLAVGEFEEIRDEADGVPLLYYFDLSKKKDALRFFGGTPDMIRVFNRMLGISYPFEQYAQVAVHDFVAGGMEHISATTMTDTRFPDERSEEDYSSTYSKPDRTPLDLVSHELAHMWFGDLVTTAHWSHAWLNEGFATYFQALYLEKCMGVEEFRQNMMYKAASYLDDDESRYRRPIVERLYVYPDDLFDTVLYEKAAWMLHQLRFILGDEVFFAGITLYLKKFSGKNADTDDLRKVLEGVSGRDLSVEFEQFFHKSGHPEFEVEYTWREEGSTAELTVRQTQNTDEETPVFELPCDFVFYTRKGREIRRVYLGSKEENFSFQLSEKPTVVEFDPEERLLKTVRFKKSYAMLASQLELSVDATSRVKAAQELSKFKTDEAVETLTAALLREQFWAVRAEAARSLGKIGTPKALSALLSSTEVGHRKVKRAVIEGLANFKEEKAIEAVRKALLGGVSPNVQAEAALSLAKMGAKSAFSDLLQAMRIPTPNSTLTEACLEAMGRIKSDDAKKVLDEHLSYGVPTRARIGALKGLKNRGFLYDDEVGILKEILTHDNEFLVRQQVVSIVSDLADCRFLGVLRKSAEEDVDRHVRRRALEVVYSLSGPVEAIGAVSKLREELEELREENQRLKWQGSGKA